MYNKKLPLFFATVLFVLLSCQKEISNETPAPGDNNGGTGKLVRLQQGIDPDITNDSVRLISYNAANAISTIVDSLNEDTLVCQYDPSGRLLSATDSYGETATFTYDADGLLTHIDYQLAGSHERYEFSYNNKVVEKKSHYSNQGSLGSPQLQKYYTYTITDGNITGIAEYTSTGTLVQETTLTYGTEPNPFKELSLLNYGNRLGTRNIINYETLFNKNLLKGFDTNGVIVNNTYTFDANNRVSKIVSRNENYGSVYTWLLSYD